MGSNSSQIINVCAHSLVDTHDMLVHSHTQSSGGKQMYSNTEHDLERRVFDVAS